MKEGTNNHSIKGSFKGSIKRTNKETNNGSIVCKKGDLAQEIVNYIDNSVNPLSTSDIVAKTSKAWHTIDRACLMLQIKGKIEGFKVGKMNLWRLKK